MTGVHLVYRSARHRPDKLKLAARRHDAVPGVTTTTVGTSTWPIQLSDVNSQTARTAETAVASVVRLS